MTPSTAPKSANYGKLVRVHSPASPGFIHSGVPSRSRYEDADLSVFFSSSMNTAWKFTLDLFRGS